MATTQNGIDAGPFVPAGTRARFDRIQPPERHPGLQLDKFSVGGAQKDLQAEALKEVCATKGDKAALDWALKRRNAMLDALGATRFEATTEGPLTLHLSRASALENAGICLHPLHGFCYLPGSGLKGMARAWALTEAGLTEDDPTFTAIFGRSPDPKKNVAGTAGAVVFHDAWPLTWPRLVRDIVTNHHKKYYQDSEPPGDWMEPVPVQFLAVEQGWRFSFALSVRSGADAALASALVATAADWLRAALTVKGAGAKTNAGYGTFVPVEGPRPAPPAERSLTVTLDLVSPAFFAGATQDGNDCDLRPATLRGLLRWWWRTLHVAHVSLKDLKNLETLVWGDVKTGGSVRVALTPIEKKGCFKFDKDDAGFYNKNNLQKPSGKKTTQGLFYSSYGMDEKSKNIRRQRWCMEAGSRWQLTLTARSPLVLRQAASALWLLCNFGGAGSKSRKGFGSFADVQIRVGSESLIDSLNDCKSAAAEFRSIYRIVSMPSKAETASIDDLMGPLEIDLPWRNPWFALDQVGYATQAFAQKYKHNPAKQVLGLPRKIHGPKDDGPITNRDGIRQQANWEPPVWLGHDHPRRPREVLPERFRDASPVHYHLTRSANGTLALRVVAFPSRNLGGKDGGRALFADLFERLREELGRRCSDPALSRLGQSALRSSNPAPFQQNSLPAPGTRVRAVLLEEKTKKGGWKARYPQNGTVGPIQNTQDVPSNCKAGDEVELVIRSRTDFGWPTLRDDAPPKSPITSQNSGPSGGAGRRR
ncbi:type III-B CRISPR module RAMP protein Cmr6 [Rhodospirillum centenum]|uniref:CRISPR-associated protein, TM1791 family n=1 Tax=Rhodospirillum centenum (strain ATCC 51521 / SW) TaxID=414684 RepID=B6IX20_RHOCS|nr:type III-B CRISPR module RAMP protein Cmr6 [Rhodospirillum centenum]ACJ00844.1 CRISPR-associated protein, TM1791 family [Rhodospirillum centenum SW]